MMQVVITVRPIQLRPCEWVPLSTLLLRQTTDRIAQFSRSLFNESTFLGVIF